MAQVEKYEALKRLKDLLEKGVLTQDEFNKEKAKILGNSVLTDEQKAQLKKIEALKEAGILTQEEYEAQKRAISSSNRPNETFGTTAHNATRPNPVRSSVSSEPKKKNNTVWIILGAVACIVIVLIAIGGGSGGYSGGYDGLMSDPYSTVDYYINYNDNYWREGNTVYYTAVFLVELVKESGHE